MGDCYKLRVLEPLEIPPALFRVDIRVSHCSSTSPSRAGFEAVQPLAPFPLTQKEVDNLLTDLKHSSELRRARLNVIKFWDSRKAAESAIEKLQSEGSKEMYRIYKVGGAELAKGGTTVIKGSCTRNADWVVGNDASEKWPQAFWVWGSVPVIAVEGSYVRRSTSFESRNRKFFCTWISDPLPLASKKC